MSKIKIIIPMLGIIFILERLYLLPIYVSLDTKPKSIQSAMYLVKSISHHTEYRTML